MITAHNLTSPDPTDERLIRDEIDMLVCKFLEARNFDLSDGLSTHTIKTDHLIRLVGDAVRATISTLL